MQDFPLYFELGWQHILDWQGYDHILFVIALCGIYTLKDWRKVLLLVTAFTLGHSLTLALSVYGKLRPSSALIEFLIPLTIVATTLQNIVSKKQKPGAVYFKYLMASLFGLIHGLGFSNYLRSLLGRSTNIVSELFAFNLGLEFGQILIVMSVLILTFMAMNVFRSPKREWNLFLSSAIFGISLIMSLERLNIYIQHT